MQIAPGNNLCTNHTAEPLVVTWEFQADPGEGLQIDVLDAGGNSTGGCEVPAGRTEYHSFTVPPQGTLVCRSGKGACEWKGSTFGALIADRIRRLKQSFLWVASKYPEHVSADLQAKLLLTVYLVAIVWVNAYVCRQALHIEYTARANSMQGFWIAIAKHAGAHWFKPSWWPYWYNGMPFEYTYAPLAPGVTALLAKIARISAAHAFNVLSVVVYCLAPLGLFLLAAQVTGRRGWSFVAAIVYSVSAPTEFVLPDTKFSWLHVKDARRLYLSSVWDELPHQLALALVCVAIFFLLRALRKPGFLTFLPAGLFLWLGLLASAFGATDTLLILGCLLITLPFPDWKRTYASIIGWGLTAYAAMCPFLPPSLIFAIRRNTTVFANMEWNKQSGPALAGFLLVGALLWLISWKLRPAYLRFALLFSYATWTIPALRMKWDLHFVPEPDRYKVELELAIALLLVFAAAQLIDRLPGKIRIAMALVLLWPAYVQVASLRRFSKNTIQSVDVTQTIEYQVAKWTEANLPGWRVDAEGSFWPWLDTFSKVPQFSGGSYPTTYNRTHLLIESQLPGKVDDSVMPPWWYKAYGVDAVIMPDVNSPEFWRPHERGHQFDPVFPIVWNERDTKIYAIPRPSRSLAHAIPRSAFLSRSPEGSGDLDGVKRYVTALEAANRPATFQWLDDNRAHIHATLGAAEALSVQVTYHPGWKARSGTAMIPISRDGLGEMVLTPSMPGDYDIDLVYEGDAESWTCRGISALTLLAVASAAVWKLRRRVFLSR